LGSDSSDDRQPQPAVGARHMILPRAEWQRRAGMKPLLAALGASEGQTRYVGGCVRDTMLQLPVSDIDLATRLQPREVIERLQKARIKAVPTGIAHGTVTAVIHGSPVEITTLRRDVATDGRRATIAYTEDWKEDAARRDFTMNALFADPETHELFDYFGGEEDLIHGIVRFIGEPLRRIAEDHLRILRFFRFHARFGTTEPNAEALEACIARANDLMALSRERIADEFMKLLVLERAPETIKLMAASGILKPVLPEIGEEAAASLRQLSDRELALGVAADPVRRLAALLPPAPDLVAGVARRLKLSNRNVKRLHCAALREEPAPQDPLELAYWIGTEEAKDRLLLGSRSLSEVADALELLSEWQRPRLPVGGGDLIKMGLQAGPSVAAALQAIEREWVSSGFPSDPEVIDEIAKRQVRQLLRDSQ
jgi:poly(A) polymerase